jgi:hypothetical protein
VVVTAAGDGDGHLIEVADRGFGMTDQELAWANRRLAGDIAADPAGLAAGDRLGLLVAARLAARNGFGVRLDRSPGPGPAMLTAGRPRPVRFCAEPWRSNHRSAVTGATSERTPQWPHTRPGQGKFGRFAHCSGIDTDDSVPAPSSPAVRKVTADAS